MLGFQSGGSNVLSLFGPSLCLSAKGSWMEGLVEDMSLLEFMICLDEFLNFTIMQFFVHFSLGIFNISQGVFIARCSP